MATAFSDKRRGRHTGSSRLYCWGQYDWDPSELRRKDLLCDFSVNVAGAMMCAQQVAPGMIEHKEGAILFTGGMLALDPFHQGLLLPSAKQDCAT